MKRQRRELHPLLTTATGPSLIKYLASCNTTIRSQSLRQLQTWLKSQPQHLSHYDIKKLWKGLFYSLWHSDKSPNQLALIDRLTSLFLSLDPALSLDFFRGFLITLRREWPGIDRLRLDKFYLLIRKFVKALFELIKDRKWDKEVLEGYFRVLENDALIAEDELKGNGVCYHLVSVFVEELKGVGFPVNKEVVEGLFAPYFKVLGKSKDKVLVGKVKGCVFGELVDAGKALLEKRKLGEDCDAKSDLLGVVALTMGLSGRFYEVGSSEKCVQGNRKVVMGLHEEFLKLERELEASKVEIVVPEYSYEAEEEVPQLVLIDDGSNGLVELNFLEGIGVEGQDDDGSRKKKSKRAKKEGDGEDKKVKKKKSKEETKEVDGDDKEAKKKHKKAKKVDGDDKEAKKKSKKAKKEVDGDDKEAKKKTKKKRKKDKDENEVTEMESPKNGNDIILTDADMENLETLVNDVELNENVISNLQKQFEKVAAEGGDEEMDDDSDISGTPFLMKHNTRSNKKKRGKRGDSNGAGDSGVEMSAKSGEKSGKKVTFSMKNNIFWKPTTPLPPESLRLPPTVVPRGSALKKGVPPGPVVEMATPKKRVNQRKKALKRTRSATPVKRRNKVVTGSA